MELNKSPLFRSSIGLILYRIAWGCVWFTVWQVCISKIYFLRPILLRLFGADVPLRSQFSRSCWIEIPKNFSCGEFSAFGKRVTIYSLGMISVGKHTVVSQDAYLCAGTHDYDKENFPLVLASVSVGDSCWLAAGCFIGPHVTIGSNSIVAARSVVVKDVADNSIVGGNPAKLIRIRN